MVPDNNNNKKDNVRKKKQKKVEKATKYHFVWVDVSRDEGAVLKPKGMRMVANTALKGKVWVYIMNKQQR